MPLYQLYSYSALDGLCLAVWEVTESLEQLVALLPEVDRRELEAFATDKRKCEFLGARLALKTLLGREVHVLYDESRKPYLADNSFNISISHSGKWIAVLAHPELAVGIDIEVPTEKIGKVCRRFLSETEQVELSGCADLRQLQLAWSAKEALYKVIGKDAVDFANQLRIFPFEVKAQGEICAEHLPAKKKYKLKYIQQPLFTLVCCVAKSI